MDFTCAARAAPAIEDPTKRIALLRGINVGGNRKVSMAELRGLLAKLRLDDPRSLLTSGNLLFRSKARSGDLEQMLELETEKRLGLKTDYFVRSAKEWRAIIENNPFPDAAKRDPGRLIVMFLKNAPPGDKVDKLRAAIVGRETVDVVGRQAYLIYPDGAGNSRLTNVIIDRNLGTRGTGRNWNTVLKLEGA